jgi:hypothetical protein
VERKQGGGEGVRHEVVVSGDRGVYESIELQESIGSRWRCWPSNWNQIIEPLVGVLVGVVIFILIVFLVVIAWHFHK